MRVTLALAALVCGTLPADARPPEACRAARADVGAAIRVGDGPGALGRTPEACPRNAFAVEAGGAITLDLDDFYGGLAAQATLAGRLVVTDGGWLSVTLPAVGWTYAANASIEASAVELGPLTLGAHLVSLDADPLVLAPYLRFVLPTDTGYMRATRWGGELGASLLWRAVDRLELVTGLSAGETLVVNAPTTIETTRFALTADLAWSPTDWFTLAGGFGLRVTATSDAFESFDPRFALRFYPWHRLLVDLSGMVPLAGRDRTTAVVLLSVGWIFPD